MIERDGVLAINAGSSSIKFAMFGPDLDRTLGGELEEIGTRPRLGAFVGEPMAKIEEDWSGPSADDTPTLEHLSIILNRLTWFSRLPARHGSRRGPAVHKGAVTQSSGLAAIGHRIAIGGLEHSGPALVTPALLEWLRTLVPLAPLHQPRNLRPLGLTRPAALRRRKPQERADFRRVQKRHLDLGRADGRATDGRPACIPTDPGASRQ